MRKLTMFHHFTHLLRNIFKNKVRFTLISLGLMVPAIVLMTSFFTIDSLYYSQFNEYYHYEENNLIQVDLSSSANAPRVYLQAQLGDQMISFKNLANGYLFDVFTEESTINLHYDLIATNQSFSGGLVMYGDYVMPSSLVSGRLFENDDFTLQHQVVIIDSLTALLLFPEEDAVGKRITIPLYSTRPEGYVVVDQVAFEIIGVVQTAVKSEITFSENYKANEDFIYTGQFYTTTSLVFSRIPRVDDVRYVFYNSTPLRRIDPFTFNGITTGVRVYNVTYFDQIVSDIQAEYQTLKLGFLAGSVILLILSSASMVSIMIFAVKERIGEIGVKKAFGATKVKVLLDFLIEGVLVGLFSFVLGFVVSIFFVYIGFYIYRLSNPLMYTYSVFIEFRTVLLSFLMILMSCLIASVIPSRYAAQININDAIKFE
ncbi:MAG: ABC transporter permease [Candidatus Izemoplasmatales bacterium]|nr:ABC transporter permease [bacterium]MDZ4196443.1 ABC transporter permease [Candidatus Izemoplasmatales bacterium]